MTGEKRVLGKWNDFASKVIDPEAPPIQRQEMREAFYAGATAMFNPTLNANALELTEDESLRILEEIRQELVEYVNEVEGPRVRMSREGDVICQRSEPREP